MQHINAEGQADTTPFVSSELEKGELISERDTLLNTVCNLIEREGYSKAFALIENWLESSPDDIEFLRLKADVLFSMGNDFYQQAIIVYKSVAARQPREVAVLLRLGELYVNTNQPVEAENAYNAIIATIDAQSAEAFHGLGRVFLIRFSLEKDLTQKEKLKERAKGYFKTALEKDPNCLKAHVNLAIVEGATDPKLALKLFQDAIDIYLKNPSLDTDKRMIMAFFNKALIYADQAEKLTGEEKK